MIEGIDFRKLWLCPSVRPLRVEALSDVRSQGCMALHCMHSLHSLHLALCVDTSLGVVA